MLVLQGFPLTSDSLSTIVRLPNLEEFFLTRTIFLGGEWNIGEEDSFENLKYLYLEAVTLAKWEFGEESFPMIEKLVLWKCHMLEEIPPSFGDICSLKIIKLVKSPQLEYSAQKIKEYVEAMMGGDELQEVGSLPARTYNGRAGWWNQPSISIWCLIIKMFRVMRCKAHCLSEGGTFKSIDKLEKITNEVKLEQSPGATSPVMQTTSNPPASISTTVADSAEQLVDAHVMKEKEVQIMVPTLSTYYAEVDFKLNVECSGSLMHMKTQILLPLYLPSGVVHVEQQVDAQQVELNLINSPILLRRLLLLFQLLSYPDVDAPALAPRDISLGHVPKSSKRNRKVTTSTRSSRL
ncbi:hypothetical protein CQW23_13710 [Capsicum baccatum]|uniref:Uncharacterized protein n=1 Tax=Capsicum baccatum TaxID=33114 RepID=A0A2G2WH56_CAPBA|nr:hypothetical protein CQW23_13710 [Capsicum baccatum]